MSREELEELAWRWRELARSLANSAGEDSSTSSRPPSSDDPYRRGERGKPAAADRDGGAAPSAAPPENAGERCEKKTAKPAGKKPGAKGFWRSQPIVVSAEIPHAPIVCAACQAPWGRTWSADASARTTASNSPAAKWLFKSRRPSTSTSPCAALAATGASPAPASDRARISRGAGGTCK